jgi:hypothetical protein
LKADAEGKMKNEEWQDTEPAGEGRRNGWPRLGLWLADYWSLFGKKLPDVDDRGSEWFPSVFICVHPWLLRVLAAWEVGVVPRAYPGGGAIGQK